MATAKFKRTKSDYYDDYRRNAENIYRRHGDKIRNRQDFDDAYDIYFKDERHIKNNKEWRESVYSEYTSKTTKIGIPQNYRRAVRSEDQVRRIQGRQIQTKQVTIKGRKKIYTFDVAAFKKGRLVHARKVQTKRGVRYVDASGQFVSLRSKR
jgi:hypothetical protein